MTQEVGDSKKINTWASSGTIVEPTLAKKENGWDLGEQPPHEYANWILNVLGKSINHILQNGVPAWNSETTYAVDNFTSNGGVIYKAKTENTNSQPPNNNWQAVAPYPVAKSVKINNGVIELDGDATAPGNRKYYGTNDAGERGFHTLVNDSFETGDLKLKYGTGELAGYVRLNGRTIGSTASTASERANDDVQSLFEYLWNEDSNLAVSGGRGASANADFVANKVLTLPHASNRALVAIDGMGGANTDLLTDALDGKVLGATGGSQEHQLTVAELAAHSHKNKYSPLDIGSGGLTDGAYSGVILDGRIEEAGEDEPHNNVQPTFIFGTVYIKI